MEFIIIIYKFIKKIILVIFNFLKAQFNFVKNVFKTQGFKGILLLFINLILAFFGGFIYEKNRSKKPQGRKADKPTKRGFIRQPGHIDRKRGAINDIPDERRLWSDKEGWQDRDTERNIPGEMRKSQETRQSFKNHSKRVWYTTDDTTEYQAQREENSRRNTDT